MDASKYRIFVSCAPGIESLLTKECRTLGLKPIQDDSSKSPGLPNEDPGGVLLEGGLEDLYRCNLHLRTASRVSVRVGEFYAAAFSELRKKAARLPWEHFLLPGQPVKISVSCHKSKLYHSDAVAERVLGAINDHFAALTGSKSARSKLSADGQLILVRLVNNQCTISMDSSGNLLHKRGYRQETAKAPLRETLAAALLLAVGYDGSRPLIDPFCGSGTIPIEAALIAGHIPPGIAREFSFTRWPNFDPAAWNSLLQQARRAILPPAQPIIGYDRDAGAIKIAAANAARAGQKEVVNFKQQPISELQPLDTTGWIVTNPPYGVRVHSNKDLRDLFARFGSILLNSFSGWQVGVLSNDPVMTGNLALPDPDVEWQFINGGIPVKFHVFQR